MEAKVKSPSDSPSGASPSGGTSDGFGFLDELADYLNYGTYPTMMVHNYPAWRDRILAQLSALRSALASVADREAECARLRADAERLDWLEQFSDVDLPPAAVYIGFDDLASVVTLYVQDAMPYSLRGMLDVARHAYGPAAVSDPAGTAPSEVDDG